MEVGAVKQAFNNEVIQLKKKLDQAKTQIINKLTRKAKTLTQKKAPDHLAEKLKRKATSAVNDVMAIKKINNKDLAKFAITHTGSLNDFLNKPNASTTDRACARLLLHKALQDKYQLLRSRFTDVPIEDLFMSRLERQKIKKEEQEKRKLKKKEKEDRKRKRESEKNNEKTPVQAEGDWSVEDIDIDELILNKKFVPKVKSNEVSDDEDNDSEKQSDDEKEVHVRRKVVKSTVHSDSDNNGGSDDESEAEKVGSDYEGSVNESGDEEDDGDELNNGDDGDDDEQESKQDSGEEEEEVRNEDLGDEENSESDKESKNYEKTTLPEVTEKTTKPKPKLEKQPNTKPVKEDNRKKLPKLNKDKAKTKNFTDKMQSKKSKKGANDFDAPQSNKIVDPFFITATGENYMSLAEPRGPDEVKEVHRQGNRQERRAAMFGHAPKARPRFNNKGNYNNNNKFGDKNDKFAAQNGFKNRNPGQYNKFDKQEGHQKRDFGNKSYTKNSYNDKSESYQDKRQNFKRKFDASDNIDKKSSEPEKLHPSWAAKKKMSGIQPFQGRKTVFD